MALFGACMALGFVFFAFVRGGGCMSLFRIGVAARVWLHGALFLRLVAAEAAWPCFI